MRYLFLIFITSLFLSCKNSNISKEQSEIKKISKIYNKSICKTSYASKIIYVEKSRYDNKFVMYNRGSGFILSMGYDCEIPIDNFCFLFTNFGKSTRKAEWLYHLKYLYADSPVKSQTDIAPGYNSAINSFRRFEMFGPFNENFLNDFQYYGLKIENDSTKSLKFKSENTNHIFNGTIYYNTKSNIVTKVILDECEFYSEVFRKFHVVKVIIKYSYYKNNIYLSSIEVDFNYQKIKQYISIQMIGQPLMSLNLSKKEWFILTENDVCPIIEYNDKLLPELLSDEDISEIRLDLESDSKIENQFSENNGKIYYECILKDGTEARETSDIIGEYLKIKDKIIKEFKIR